MIDPKKLTFKKNFEYLHFKAWEKFLWGNAFKHLIFHSFLFVLKTVCDPVQTQRGSQIVQPLKNFCSFEMGMKNQKRGIIFIPFDTLTDSCSCGL